LLDTFFQIKLVFINASLTFRFRTLSSMESGAFITTVASDGRLSVLRDQGAIYYSVQLESGRISLPNAVVPIHVDGEPCIAIAGCDKAGVFVWQNSPLCEVRSLPYKDKVHCICRNAAGTKLYFGTQAGCVC
jgi:hypothetical protein